MKSEKFVALAGVWYKKTSPFFGIQGFNTSVVFFLILQQK